MPKTESLTAKAQSLSDVHLVVVDDQPAVARVVYRIAMAHGARAVNLCTPAAAAETLRNVWGEEDTVVVCDHDLGEYGTHATVLQAARELECGFVLMSGDPEAVARARAEGIVAIDKPFDGPALVAAILQAIQKGAPANA